MYPHGHDVALALARSPTCLASRASAALRRRQTATGLTTTTARTASDDVDVTAASIPPRARQLLARIDGPHGLECTLQPSDAMSSLPEAISTGRGLATYLHRRDSQPTCSSGKNMLRAPHAGGCERGVPATRRDGHVRARTQAVGVDLIATPATAARDGRARPRKHSKGSRTESAPSSHLRLRPNTSAPPSSPALGKKSPAPSRASGDRTAMRTTTSPRSNSCLATTPPPSGCLGLRVYMRDVTAHSDATPDGDTEALRPEGQKLQDTEALPFN